MNSIPSMDTDLITVDAAKCGAVTLKAFQASTFFSRLRGLHAVWPLAADEALVINPCNAIHTMTMSESIDVIFLNENGRVLKAKTVPRFRFSYCAGAASVVEMEAGSLKRLGIQVGDSMSINRS